MPNQITTSRASFLEALATIAASRKTLQGEAVIMREGATMEILLGGASVAFEAQGAWDQQVRVPASFVAALHRVPPLGDPITVTVQDERITIGSVSVGCVINAADQRALPVLPLGADLATKARLLLSHSQEELERAGIYDEVSKAGHKMEALVQRAAKALSPFGVTESEVMALVKARLGVPSE